uniref:Mitochondrial carrier protein n=2 Tax=Phaeomonas parva TaxID=124430 RepID=A0A7S1XU61_9STRA|mmetsp:Transcript_37634/g.117672  ORF Transcript_37634/g.117672 Transcript_37634/m.117672 type:complete len:221 (+) Transcript_37634:671-1333(+)
MPSSALYFGTYEFMKARLLPQGEEARRRMTARRRVATHAAAAASGNVASSMFFVPKEVLKQRAQVAGTGMSQALVSVLRERGVTGLFAGYTAVLYRNIPSAIIRFSVFEEIKHKFELEPQASQTPALLAAGAVAGAVSSFCTTPLDVVKTRYAIGALGKHVGVPAALYQIGAKEGLQALWAGCLPRMAMSGLFTGVGFTSFEYFKAQMRRLHDDADLENL